MKYLTILFASSLLFACGSDDSTDATDSNSAADTSEERAANPIDEKADELHDAMEAASGVDAYLEEQNRAIDEALEEAEGGPDPD
jgi:hypothetical protein